MKLYPKCMADIDRAKPAYVNTGHILPCCFIDGGADEEEWFNKLRSEHLKVSNVSDIDDIYYSEEWLSFYNMLETEPENAPTQCKRFCSAPPQLIPMVNISNKKVKKAGHDFKIDVT